VGYGLDGPGIDFWQEQEIFSLLSNIQTAYRIQWIPGFLLLSKSGRDVMLTIHHQVGLMIRMNTAMALSPYMP